MHFRILRRGMVSAAFLFISMASAFAQDTGPLLQRIKSVGKEGAGNIEAAKAWKELVAQGPTVLPDVLGAMDDASPTALNWLRAAVEAIQDKANQQDQKVSAAKLETFIKETRHGGKSRRLAYECLTRLDPSTPERLLPKLLDDPSSELRRDAVAVKLERALKGVFNTPAAKTEFLKELLQHARDRDQVNTICEELKKQGVDIDLTAHYGFITRWLLVGPFDSSGGIGFSKAYPPENGFDAKSSFTGKAGAMVRWREHSTAKPLGLVDLNEAVGKLHGAVVYGYAAVSSEVERPIEIRAASNNAIRIWLNGKEIYFREEYHHGVEIDQHVGKGVLKAGRNQILVKVCQNEQTEDWAQRWSFQVRVCDALGAAVPVANVTEKTK